MFTKVIYSVMMSKKRNGHGERHLKILATVRGRSISAARCCGVKIVHFIKGIVVDYSKRNGQTTTGAILSRNAYDHQTKIRIYNN